MSEIQEVVDAWQEYIQSMPDWHEVVAGTEPKQTQCGPVYEPPSPLPGRRETFAVSDMREVSVAYPHYHDNGETEVYFVISGLGKTVVGNEVIPIEKGSVVITPPGIVHYTFPKEDLVMVVVNHPYFNAENIVEPEGDDPEHEFDAAQYQRMLNERA